MRLASWIYFIVSVIVLGLKYWAYEVTHSQAVYSDALESFVNVFAATLSVWVVRFVQSPADAEHPYGHGKMEYFSAAFEGGLISFAAFLIAVEAVKNIFYPRELGVLDTGVLLSFAAGLINLVLAIYLKKTAREHKSSTLMASGEHVLSDVTTTLFTTLGLLLVAWTKFYWIDSVVALILAGMLGYSGYKIVARSVADLLDAMDPQLIKDLGRSMQKFRQSGIIDIHQLKMIRSGKFHHIDAHLVVPEFWTVEQTHQVTQIFEQQVVADYHYDGEIAFHLDPCERKYCSSCDLETCDVRVRKFIEQKSFHNITLIEAPNS
jgi:cation diffusion facilitator family transporter